MLKCYTYILLFFLCSLSTRAQENFVFSPIDCNEGLSENHINCITQLRDGRMVIVADGLVNIYNGTSFSYLHHNEEYAYHLSEYTGYTRAYVGNEGKLWIKDYQKLILFDIQKEAFITELDNVLHQQGIHEPLKNIFMDTEGDYWFLTASDKLIRQHQTVNSVFIDKVSLLSKTDDLLYDLAVVNDRLYLFYKSGTMICFDIETAKELYRESPFGTEENRLYTHTIHVVPNKQYLYQIRNGHSGKGIVHRFNTKSRKWNKILETENILNTLSVDNKGNCWISTQNGFWFIDEFLMETKHIPGLRLVDGRILKTVINTQFNDADGGLWVGTDNRGILYYHPDRFRFKTFSHTHFKIPDSMELKVCSFAEKDNDTWIGTNQGLYTYNHTHSNQPIVPELSRYPGIPEKAQCSWIWKDASLRIWICTSNGYGLYCIKGNKIRNYTFPFRSINYLYESFNGNLYLCCDQGFGLFDPDSGEYQRIDSIDQPDLGNVYQLIEYGQEQLMGVSDQGIFSYNSLNNQFQLAGQSENKHPMFRHSNHTCHCLYIDSRGFIWFGTQDGVNVWNTDEQKLYSFYTEDGLVNNSIFSIHEDYQQRIWLSTANGISRIDLINEGNGYKYYFTSYNQYDGVIEYEYLPRSAILTPDSKFLCGGLGGFNAIDLKRIDSNQQQLPSPIFLGFSLFGTEVKQGEEYDKHILLKQSITATKEIVLNYRQNFFGLEFSALNYVNPTQTYYRYQLEGLDTSWQEITANDGMGRANYTNLSPGTYTFKVHAANNSRKWNQQCAQITIIITPPFWKTPIAYIIYLLLFTSIVYLVASWWFKYNKKRMQRMQKEELDQMKFRFFTNISHELRTPLTLILTPLDSVIKKIEDNKIKAQLESIHQNANNLLKLVNQLLDFRKLEMNGEKINLSLCNIHEFTKAISLSFEEVIAHKEISFDWSVEAEKTQLYVNTDKLYKIINNLLSNAYKFTPQGGHIGLHIKLTQRENVPLICFEISDTGCGIPTQELPHIFTRFYQVNNKSGINTGSGIGLHMVQEYVKLHNGTIDVKSEPGKGSVFTVCLPTNLHPASKESKDIQKQEKPHELKILIVEDNEEFLNFLADELSKHYLTLTATNGEKALTQIAQHSPDLIVSDLMMPEMNGIELCQRIKNDIQTSHIPFILLTARSSEDVQIEAYESGADICMAKPFNMDILQLHIQHLIEQQENRKALFKKTLIISPKIVATTPIDEVLLKKALECIEKNMSNPSYSVEQFSREMCMDRTGLYRKLMAISGQPPTAFIRSIRLKRSAQLLEQGLSVSEVADLVGFGTISYFSKCFQEEYGVKPSQYLSK